VTRLTLAALATLLCLPAAPLQAQPAAQAPAAPAAAPPPIRRWVDVQQLHLAGRYRWFENSDGKLISSSVQWQPLVRARFLFDQGAKYSLNGFAAGGSNFAFSWNNTGGGTGTYSGKFNVKQLFLQAEPVKGLEFQVGGLHMYRGQLAELVTYDTDAFIEGERVTVRPATGWLKEVAVTTGYFGDYTVPNLFKRFDRMSEWNYGQGLVSVGLGPRATATVDYTYEDGRDILREGVNIRLPASAKVFKLLKFESYQRVSDVNGEGEGFNASTDLVWKRLAVTAGVMSVDALYSKPQGPFNGDRYESGTRWYSVGTITLTPELGLQWYHTQAFANDFVVNSHRRWEVVLIFNPTATLKRAGIF
jgi:hypothetical protein